MRAWGWKLAYRKQVATLDPSFFDLFSVKAQRTQRKKKAIYMWGNTIIFYTALDK